MSTIRTTPTTVELLSLDDLQLGTENFSALFLGSTGSGKSTTVQEFVEKYNWLCKEEKENILVVWAYNLEKPSDLRSSKQVEVVFIQGLPKVDDLLAFRKERPEGSRIVVVLDDCLTLLQAAKTDVLHEYGALVTEYSRRGFTLFFLCQDVFPAKNPFSPLLRKNSAYTVFFSFLGDFESVLHLATRQFGAKNKESFRQAYTKATQRRGGYLVIDNNLEKPALRGWPLRNFLFLPRQHLDKFKAVYHQDPIIYKLGSGK